MQDTLKASEISMDANALSREELFTDSRVGTIRKLIPVTPEGEDDANRPVEYFGSTQIMTPAGALPLNFEIPAKSLAEAVAGFGEAAQEAVESTMQELRELQRQAASSIVVPRGGMDPGALGGGGKIRMP
jgi:hypothetical protein